MMETFCMALGAGFCLLVPSTRLFLSQRKREVERERESTRAPHARAPAGEREREIIHR